MRPDPAITSLLASAGWAGAMARPMAGDASTKRFARLTGADGRRAILMTADPSVAGTFSHVTGLLQGMGLSAPRILAADTAAGHLLIEDLGDALYATVIADTPELEKTLYRHATAVLVRLGEHPAPDLPRYDTATMVDQALFALRWYHADTPARDAAFAACLTALLDAHVPAGGDVLMLRDYHAQNLVWLPQRQGPARVGLLDFQDATRAHPAYDLVSLLQDARRDVSPAVAQTVRDEFLRRTGHPEEAFNAAFAVLGAQRALRILGIFARLCLAACRAQYVPLMPRVWAHLQTNLAHPALAPLRDLVARDLPAPCPDFLKELTARCGTHDSR